jgi:hypothetical protein
MSKAYIFIILGFSTMLFLFSCTKDFEDINTNPNEADRVSDPSLLLPAIIRTTANRSWDNSFDRFAIAADQIANQFVSTFSDWSRSDADRFFWSNYDKVKDLNYLISISKESGMANYQAVGIILKSWIFQGITDNFGPVPYSEAGKANQDINFPKYDSQEDIYAGILADLEIANSLLGTTSELVNGDILFNGNIQNWKKLANGLAMRILMRQSARKDPSVQMQKIMASPATYPLFTSYRDQAALQYLGVRANAHPAFTGNVSDWASSTRLSHNMEIILKSMNDPRLAVFAMPTPASQNSPTPQYGGVPNGISNVEAWNGGVSNHSPIGLLWVPEQFSPNFASMTAAQSVIMSYSELQFILAEARLKGYITAGDAETYYLNGIIDQFAYYASRIPSNFIVPKASQVIPPASYYTQVNVAFTGTTQEKLNKIYTQKWLSLFLCGAEAWSEWRRVGVPAITPGPRSNGYVPVRYIYPADEMRLNEENYNKAVQMLGGDGDALTTRVWWDID